MGGAEQTAFFAIIGYLLGSLMFAPFWCRVLGHENILSKSKDGNPGTANAYQLGGFRCGTLTLLCDLGKGFLPVFLYFHFGGDTGPGGALVLAAPVLGHIFPIYHRFRGGKGIATSFGCLLGLIPDWLPLSLLAAFFILFTAAICITPHLTRTLVSYLALLAAILPTGEPVAVKLGLAIITVSVIFRLLRSDEERERSRVKLLWMH